MNESGVLGRYLPEFGHIVAKMQFNMYHSYTVDEHTLRALGVIADIRAGKLSSDHPLSVQIMPLIADLEALYLAMLLHDTGKGGEGGQELAGARAARAATERLGLSSDRVDLVAWLVEHHLVMSDYAQKRDISDPRTIAAFARIVETPERLRLLLVLTVADIRAVGPGVWNGWKGQLLRDLYSATEALFRGGRADPATHAVTVQHEQAAAARRLLCAGASAELGIWAETMEDAYFTSFTLDEQRAHFSLVQRAEETGGSAAFAHVKADRNVTEVVITARDRRGLFADLAAGLSAMGANVVGARVYTSRAATALDIFHVQDVAGGPFGADSPMVLAKLAQALERAARGEAAAPELGGRFDHDRAAAFRVPSIVTLDNEASAVASVVEVSGRDRRGLLEALARVLADDRLQLQSAHVDGYGERAVDAFYVCDEGGAKLTDPRRISSLKGALTAVLQAEGAPPRRRLERARASAGR
jgi:[protein-PII] uridylyltransferase